MSPILLSRFLLSLRQALDPQDTEDETNISTISVFGFRAPTLKTIVGDMGEQLVYASDSTRDSEIYGSHHGTDSTTLEFRTVSDGMECYERDICNKESPTAEGSSGAHSNMH